MEIGKINLSPGDHSLIQPRPARRLPGRRSLSGALIGDVDQVSLSGMHPAHGVDRHVARLMQVADSRASEKVLDVHRRRLDAGTMIDEEALREAARRILGA